MKDETRPVRDHKRSKNVVLGAGLGMIFGAAFGNIAIGLVIGASSGLLFESLGIRLTEE